MRVLGERTCAKCGVQVILTARWTKFGMCEACLWKVAEEVKGLRVDWFPRLPPLLWGDLRTIVGKVGDVSAVAKAANTTIASVKVGMRKNPRDRMEPWMQRKLFAPLLSEIGSHWLKVLPTRVWLSVLSVNALKSRSRSFRDMPLSSSAKLFRSRRPS